MSATKANLLNTLRRIVSTRGRPCDQSLESRPDESHGAGRSEGVAEPPLENLYPVIFLDALMVKIRHEGRVENRAVYVAIGIDAQGQKDVLWLWTSANERAKFWLQVLTDLRNRGVKDIFIACVDGLKGFPQAIETVFPPGAGATLHRPPHPR